MHARLKIGVLANEFFDAGLGRLGGFGWVARELGRLFRNPALGVEIVYLTGELAPDDTNARVEDVRLLPRRSLPGDVLRARRERLDLLLLVDYRPNYRRVCYALPDVPKLVWARDPRGPREIARVDALRLPGESSQPKGTFQPDCASLATVARLTRALGRPVAFAGTAPFLRPRLEQITGPGVVQAFHRLPNPLPHVRGPIRKPEQPLVLFLARLDPYKRPWLFVELARRFPAVRFAMAGHRHHTGTGSWRPRDLPANLELLGHVDGAEKEALLAEASVLVNTSVHEGLAVSLLEALAFETPLLSCVDPEALASRFGVFAGDFPGDGEAALPALEKGLTHLLEDPARRRARGRAGRAWVEAHHGREPFLAAFDEVLASLALSRGAG